MRRAIEQHKAGQARVLPIIIRDCDWIHTSFARLQCLPLNNKPVTEWPSRDSAWKDVAKGIRRAIGDLSLARSPYPVRNYPYPPNPILEPPTRLPRKRSQATALSQSQTISGMPVPKASLGCDISRSTFVRGLAAIAGLAIVGGGIAWLLQPSKSSRNSPLSTTQGHTPGTSSVPTPTPTPTWTSNQPIGQVNLADRPALITWNNTLYIAYADHSNSHSLTLVSSKDGVSWTLGRSSGQQSGGFAPALAVLNNTLYMAYTAVYVGGGYYWFQIISSKDGMNWTSSVPIGQSGGGSPALAVLNNTLYMAFRVGSETNIQMASSVDGVNWIDHQFVSVPTSSDPTLVVWNDTLYMAFVDIGSSHRLMLISSKDGMIWTSSPQIGQSSPGDPALAVWNDTLYMAFGANDSTGRLLIISSKDGVNWINAQFVGQASSVPPALVVFNNTLYLAFAADNGGHQLSLVSLQG